MNFAVAAQVMAVCFVIGALTLPRRLGLAVSVCGSILVAVMVPSQSAPFAAVMSCAVLSAASLGLGLLRNLHARPRGGLSVWVLALIVYTSGMAVLDMPTANDVWLRLLQGLVYLMLYVAAITLGTWAFRVVGCGLLLSAVLQAVVATTEVFGGALAPWPRADGTDIIASRVNAIAPGLIGRAMGSLAQPIPLGIVAGAASVVALAFFLQYRQVRYLALMTISLYCLVLSGTRSALLAVTAAVAYMLVRSFRLSRLPAYIFLTVAIVSVVLAVDLPGALGLAGIESTNSYTHRVGTLSSLGDALSEPGLAVLFGHGYENVPSLFASGEIGGADGITVPDNEYFRTLLGAGLFGLFLLVGAILVTLRAGNAASSALLVTVGLALFTFDGLAWNAIAVIFYCALGAAAASTRGAVQNNGRQVRHSRTAVSG